MRNNAVINCARAELELSPLYDVPINNNHHYLSKLVIKEGIYYSDSVSSVFCSDISDEVVFFEPSNLFPTRKALLPYVTYPRRSDRLQRPLYYESLSCCFKVNVLDACDPLILGTFSTCKYESYTADLDARSAINFSYSSANDLFCSSIPDGLSPLHRSELLHLQCQFHNSFNAAQPPLGRTSTVRHYIDTGPKSLLRQRPYRVFAKVALMQRRSTICYDETSSYRHIVHGPLQLFL